MKKIVFVFLFFVVCSSLVLGAINYDCSPAQLIGDFDKNGNLEENDVIMFEGVLGGEEFVSNGDPNYCCLDVNKDGLVNNADAIELNLIINCTLGYYAPGTCGGTEVISCSGNSFIGDLEGDGDLDLDDLFVLLKINEGLLSAPENICCADINEDKNIDVSDEILLWDLINEGLDELEICFEQVSCVEGQLIGDIDNNKFLTQGDVFFLQDIIEGNLSYGGNIECFDLNEDGILNDIDRDLLIQIINGDDFPPGIVGGDELEEGEIKIMGTVRDCLGLGVPDVTVTFSGVGTEITNQNGFYSVGVPIGYNGTSAVTSHSGYFSELGEESYNYSNLQSTLGYQDFYANCSCCSNGNLIGDANCDGNLTVTDGIIMHRTADGVIAEPDNFCCADINDDGEINLEDEDLLNQILSGLIPSPGYCDGSGYTFEIVSCLPGQEIGDLNRDENINSGDEDLLIKIINGEIPIPFSICCVDINQDGKVDDEDLGDLSNLISSGGSLGFCGEQSCSPGPNPGGDPFFNGECLLEAIGSDLTGCEDGFLYQEFSSSWSWGLTTFVASDPSDSNYVLDGGNWYYDPDGIFLSTTCEGISLVVKCPTQIQLNFFNFWNVFSVIILLGLFYPIKKV